MPAVRSCLLALVLCLCAVPLSAAGNAYMDMSLEDLMDLTVTSMSKRAQSLKETAAAVHVLTSEDIRRSGATSIPQALRMVPGLMVAQNTASAWSIASRGRSFNPTFDNKLLVMIDGRSVYSTVFSGVFWEGLDIVMDDIDRIEVIRGPGSSVWGANAVNGIINIITRSSAETQGLMVSALAGTEEAGTGAVRYGGKLGDAGSYRIYGKYRHLRAFEDLDGDELNDGVETGSAGFRTDLNIDRDTYMTLQGDVTSGSSQNTVTYPDLSTAAVVTPEAKADLFLGNLLGRYTRSLSEESSISLQAYYSRDDRDGLIYHVCVDTFDIDFQHQFSPWDDHIAQWGLGYRLTTFDSDFDPMAVEFTNTWRSDNLFSAFVQDEIFLAGGEWVLTIGSKFEHNGQTGLELLPSARLLWHVTDEHALWGAVSRSVRTASIAEQDATYHVSVTGDAGPLPLRTSLTGNDGVGSETALSYELGYRFSPSSSFYIDVAAYVTEYDNLLSSSYAPADIYLSPDPSLHLQLDAETGNEISGTSSGGELSVTWVPAEWWKLNGWYAFNEDHYSFHGEGTDTFEKSYGKINPQHQFFLRSSMDLPHNTELDVMARYVSELDALDIPDYFTMDVRLGWRPADNIELSLVGQNLIESRHLEAATDIVYGSAGAVQRSCYLKLRVEF